MPILRNREVAVSSVQFDRHVQPTGSRSFGTFHLAGWHLTVELEAHVDEKDTNDVTLPVATERTSCFDNDTGPAVD